MRLINDIKMFGQPKLDRKMRKERLMEKLTGDQNNFNRNKSLPWHLLHPESVFKNYWNLILILLLLYTATMMPY